MEEKPIDETTFVRMLFDHLRRTIFPPTSELMIGQLLLMKAPRASAAEALKSLESVESDPYFAYWAAHLASVEELLTTYEAMRQFREFLLVLDPKSEQFRSHSVDVMSAMSAIYLARMGLSVLEQIEGSNPPVP
jgi:hypothetical protein